MHSNHNKLLCQIHYNDITTMRWMNGCNAMLKWEKNPGNHVNQRKLHMVHTLRFGKSTKVAHGRTRVNNRFESLNNSHKVI